MGRNNNPTRGSTIRHVARTIAAASAAVATLAAGLLVAGTADAATMRDPFERSIQNGNPGLWTNVGTITFSNGKKYENMAQSLGVVDRVNGKNTYCIEADTLYTGTTGDWGDWTDERTKPDAQRDHSEPDTGRAPLGSSYIAEAAPSRGFDARDAIILTQAVSLASRPDRQEHDRSSENDSINDDSWPYTGPSPSFDSSSSFGGGTSTGSGATGSW